MSDRTTPSAGEVRALANQLLSWADQLSVRAVDSRGMTEEDQHNLIIAVADAMRGTRRERTRIFPDVPLGNANWDVLLDLFIRELNGHRTSLAQLSQGNDLAVTTVHGAIGTLARCGLVERSPDEPDPAADWLTLTSQGKQGMFELLQEIANLVHVPSRRVRRAAAG